MKKHRWMSLAMFAVMVLLTGCNQGEEQGSQNAEAQASELSQDTDQIIGIAETFINQLSEGNYEEATEKFNETMSDQLTPELLEETWMALQSQFGNFIDQEYKSVEEADGLYAVLMAGIFNDADVTLRVTFDENQKIVGFFVQ